MIPTNKKKNLFQNTDATLPVTSCGVFAHWGHLKSGSQMHPSVSFLLLLSATEKTRYVPRLLCLSKTVHESNRLPVKVVLTFHREKHLNPPWSLLSRFHSENELIQHHQQQQNRKLLHCGSIESWDVKWVLFNFGYEIWTRWL